MVARVWPGRVTTSFGLVLEELKMKIRKKTHVNSALHNPIHCVGVFDKNVFMSANQSTEKQSMQK